MEHSDVNVYWRICVCVGCWLNVFTGDEEC